LRASTVTTGDVAGWQEYLYFLNNGSDATCMLSSSTQYFGVLLRLPVRCNAATPDGTEPGRYVAAACSFYQRVFIPLYFAAFATVLPTGGGRPLA